LIVNLERATQLTKATLVVQVGARSSVRTISCTASGQSLFTVSPESDEILYDLAVILLSRGKALSFIVASPLDSAVEYGVYTLII
jgi:hypothetical protein